jgi:HD-GYP domain-containing protein (c-di-GMP phosphodiesterase class II)
MPGLIAADTESIGDGVVDGVIVPAPTPPVPVPQSVTMRQARLALHAAGLLAGVDAAIASMQEPAKTAAAIEWEYASAVERNAGLVPAMAAALGMSEADIDDLFIAAAAL